MRRPVTATWSTFVARRARRAGDFVNKSAGLWPAFSYGLGLPGVAVRRPEESRDLIEQRVDVVLRGVADVALNLRAVQQPGVTLAMINDRRRVRLDGVDATPDIHHDGDVIFDELHRGHHLLDALTGQILEIAGLEDRNHAFLDFLAEQLLLIRRSYPAQSGRGVIDRFRGFEDLLGGFFGTADHGAEFAVDLGHFLAVETVAVQNRDFALGTADRIIDEIEFDLELLALLDLGAIGFEQHLGFSSLARQRLADGSCCHALAGGTHLGTDGAQLRHDLAMHGADLSAVKFRWHRHVADNGFFDTKTSAM